MQGLVAQRAALQEIVVIKLLTVIYCAILFSGCQREPRIVAGCQFSWELQSTMGSSFYSSSDISEIIVYSSSSSSLWPDNIKDIIYKSEDPVLIQSLWKASIYNGKPAYIDVFSKAEYIINIIFINRKKNIYSTETVFYNPLLNSVSIRRPHNETSSRSTHISSRLMAELINSNDDFGNKIRNSWNIGQPLK